MFEKLFKKKVAINPPPIKKDEEDSEESDIEAPEVDETISAIDAALKKASEIKTKAQKKREREEAAERERNENRWGSSCGCG